MATIEQARAAAQARRQERAVAEARAKQLKQMRKDGELMALRVECGYPLVRAAGDSLHELREDFYDHARAVNHRAGIEGIAATYATATMGGDPFADWN